MTADQLPDSFGPYAFTLEPAEAEAAAARVGLRTALKADPLTSHVAPLTAFALVVAFATVLALTRWSHQSPRRRGDDHPGRGRIQDPATGQSLADSPRAERRPGRDRAPSIGGRAQGHVRR